MNEEPNEPLTPAQLEAAKEEIAPGAIIDPAKVAHTTHSLTEPDEELNRPVYPYGELGPGQPAKPVENTAPLPAAPPAKSRKPRKRKETKADRLQAAAQAVLDAIAEAQTAGSAAMAAYEAAIDELQGALQTAQDAMENLKSVREDEYQGWYDNMSESLQQTPTGQKLQELLDIDLDPSWPEVPDFEEPDFGDAESAAQSILDADYPLGFGKD